MIQVSKNVFVETGMVACNVGCLATEAGLVMIDTPMKPTDAIKWRDEAGKKGIIQYLINTEEHADHWQGCYFFPGTLISSQITRDKLTKVPLAMPVEGIKKLDPQGAFLAKDYRIRLADITFNDNLALYVGSHTVKLFKVPGHSTGGIAVYLPEESVVFTTDIVFHKKKSWLQESDPEAWLKALKYMNDLNPEVVVPGHGPVCKKEVFQEEAGIIQKWIDAIKKAIQQGWSVEEAIARVPDQDPNPKQEGTPMTEAELHKVTVVNLYKYYSR
jgi:cyclase